MRPAARRWWAKLLGLLVGVALAAPALATPPSRMDSAAARGLQISSTILAVRRAAGASQEEHLDPQQRAELAALDATVAGSSGVRIRLDPAAGALRTLIMPAGASRLRSGTSEVELERAARRTFAEHGALFQIQDDAQQLRTTRTWRDASGSRHLSFDLMHQGVPVFGHEYRVHYGRAGELRAIQAQPVREGRFPSAAPVIAVYQAEARLAQAYPGATITDLGLRYLETARGYRLAYLHRVDASLIERWWVFTDASDGSELERLDRVQDAVVAASGTDLRGVTRNFDAWEQAGTFVMFDPSVPIADPPYDPINLVSPSIAAVGDLAILDNNHRTTSTGQDYPTSSAVDSGWDATGVSAIVNTRRVYDYYLNTFGRVSVDDAARSLVGIIHYGNRIQNAFWNGTQMVYGDGGDDFRSFAACDDVVMHEMTHGVTSATAALIYRYQSGALSESMSDVLAAMLDRDDWTIGEDCGLGATDHMRNLIDPADGYIVQPGHMDDYRNLSRFQDNGGVHTNSGIPNRAAYLLTEGLSAEGLGTSVDYEVAEQLYYRSLVTYLTPSSEFIDLREAMELSAEDLYSGDAVIIAAVRDAFDAVGIVAGATSRPDDRTPTDADPVPGADVMVYLYPQDGSYDDIGEDFDLYLQSLPAPFTGYDPDLDQGPLNGSVAVRWARPAVVTLAEGTYLYFIGTDGDIHVVPPVGPVTAVTSGGGIAAMAVSPDGSQLVYSRADDATVYRGEIATGTTSEYPIANTVFIDGGDAVNSVLSIGSLAFDFRGRRVAFDALNCVDSGGSVCDDGAGVRYRSIGVLDLRTSSQDHLFPGLASTDDLRFPAFAYNNSYLLSFDRSDSSELDATGERISSVEILDLDSGAIVGQVARGRYAGSGPELWGAAGLWGDDAHISFQSADPLSGTVGIYRAPVDTDWSVDASAPERLNDFQIGLPVMHRASPRDVDVTLSLSRSSIDFGEVAPSSVQPLTFDLGNEGNVDVELLAATLTGTAFSHNMVPGLLPRDQSMTVTVTLTAPSAPGSVDAMLMIESDGDPATITLPLTAVVGSYGSISASSASRSVAEGAGSVSIQVSRSGGDFGAVSIAYATQAGSATAGADFSSTSGTLSWADGESGARSISVPIMDDSSQESAETFRLVLSAPAGGAALGIISEVSVTITDDDQPPGGGSGGSGGGGGSPWYLLWLLAAAFVTRRALR